MTDNFEKNIDDFGIAVIGMSGRFPGADNINEFWNNLLAGKCAYTPYSDEDLLKAGVDTSIINNPKYVKAGYALSEIDRFDAHFFGFTPREAECMDPQHRLFLECAWSVFENAGYNPETYSGLVGVYAGCGQNNYLLKNLNNNPRIIKSVGDFELIIDNEKDYLTTRVSYKLNLKGPAINVQSACSTSLVAVCLGFQSLMTYQCDMALCGGASLLVPPKQGYMYKEGLIFSPDGYCRAFDASSNGTVQGEGVGAVLLKRLDEAIEDGDYIYAVIKGAAINNDGSLKAGFTAPSIEGQATAIKMAQRLADISPESISFIETHGTGTPLGDPIEIAALTSVFREKTSDNNFCALGAVKTNVGHLDAAAGITGFIKTVLSLKNKIIPPTLHFKTPNPKLNLDTSPFYINTDLLDWPKSDTPRRAGVSSFGIGGTNAHVILEEAPSIEYPRTARNWKVLPLSSKSDIELHVMKSDLACHLKNNNSDLEDAAYTLQTGRKIFDHRSIIIGRHADDVIKSIQSDNSKYVFSSINSLSNQPVVFMFTGQGSQYAGMSSNIYREEKVFSELVDYCSEKLKPNLGLDLRDVLYPDEKNREFAETELSKTSIVQPALFVIEYALAKLWISRGITPRAFIGHSIGEYVAACLANVFSLDDALKIVNARGKIIQSMPPGSMLSVPLSEESVSEYLTEGLCVATVNGDSLCVVAGETSLIEKLEASLREQNISGRILKTSHAFHSELVAPACEPFANFVKDINLAKPTTPYISNVTGSWIKPEEAVNPQYYADHLRSQVKFYQGALTLIDNSYSIFLEVGPGNTLCSFLHRTTKTNNPPHQYHAVQSLPHPLDQTPDNEMLAKALGKLWLGGAEIDWHSYYQNEKRRRLPLPSYPFQGKQYWIEPDDNSSAKQSNSDVYGNHYTLNENSQFSLFNKSDGLKANEIVKVLQDIWSEILGIDTIDIKDSFFDLGGTSLMATQLIALINERLVQELTLTDFFIDPTISGLSKLIVSTIENDTQSAKSTGARLPVLFPIQPKGGNLPLFIVAGAHENRYYDPIKMKSSYEDDFLRYLSNLIPHLGLDQPVYGFRPKGLLATETPHNSVEEMAADYIKEIRKFQPEGPYLIAGECVGGIVAYEIAQQLQRNNQKVGHLIMMDTHCPSFQFAMREKYLYIRHRLRIFRAIREALSIGKDKGLNALFSFIIKKTDSLPMLLFPITRNLRIKRQIMLRGYEYRKTLLNYRPTVYSGDTTLLLNEQWHENEPDFGWGKDFRRHIDITEVPGDHLSRLTTYGEITGTHLKNIIKNTHEKYNLKYHQQD